MFTAQATAVKTTVEYSEVSTLHGLKYIFENGKDLSISKALWFLVVLGATGFGIIWSYEEGSILNFLSDILKSYYPTKNKMDMEQKILCHVSLSDLRRLAIKSYRHLLEKYRTASVRH